MAYDHDVSVSRILLTHFIHVFSFSLTYNVCLLQENLVTISSILMPGLCMANCVDQPTEQTASRMITLLKQSPSLNTATNARHSGSEQPISNAMKLLGLQLCVNQKLSILIKGIHFDFESMFWQSMCAMNFTFKMPLYQKE